MDYVPIVGEYGTRRMPVQVLQVSLSSTYLSRMMVGNNYQTNYCMLNLETCVGIALL